MDVRPLNKISGFTLVELCVVMGIFSMFLIAFYITLEVGLKTWKIGEVRSDLQTTSQVVIKRLSSDIANTNADTVESSDPMDPNAYICFETPLYNGKLQLDTDTEKPLWQGHILYYTLDDPNDLDYDTKLLYKRYVPHNTVDPYKSEDRLLATFLADVPSYIDDRELDPNDIAEGQTLRRLCDSVASMTFDELYGTVDVEIIFQENFRKSKDAKVMFSSSGDDHIGTERYIVKCTVRPAN